MNRPEAINVVLAFISSPALLIHGIRHSHAVKVPNKKIPTLKQHFDELHCIVAVLNNLPQPEKGFVFV